MPQSVKRFRGNSDSRVAFTFIASWQSKNSFNSAWHSTQLSKEKVQSHLTARFRKSSTWEELRNMTGEQSMKSQ